MSANGHELEREYSVPSLPSRGVSEMGSRYSTQSGIYMSSYAATVFISGLVTVGVSLFSLLMALAVMLRSCENRNAGVVEMYRYEKNYDYCRNLALYAELNSLGHVSFPECCKDVVTHYVKDGQYRKDLNITIGFAKNFFSSLRPQNDGQDIVLMDADDFLASETQYDHKLMYWINEDVLLESSIHAESLKRSFLMKLYLKLLAEGWPLILFSRKPENLLNATVGHLLSSGFHGWSSLIFRMEKEMHIDFQEFSTSQRIVAERRLPYHCLD